MVRSILLSLSVVAVNISVAVNINITGCKEAPVRAFVRWPIELTVSIAT